MDVGAFVPTWLNPNGEAMTMTVSSKWLFMCLIPLAACNGEQDDASQPSSTPTTGSTAGGRGGAGTDAGHGGAGGGPGATGGSTTSVATTGAGGAATTAGAGGSTATSGTTATSTTTTTTTGATTTTGTGGASGTGGSGGGANPGTSRPSWNTGKGFYVVGNKIYDANGAEFRMRGVNHTHWWGGLNEAAIPYIAASHANTSRAVFGPDGGAVTPAQHEEVVRQYIAAGIVPVVDYHNATCGEDPAQLNAAVDMWLGPDKAWLQSLERYVIVNITNEWGPNSTVWRDAYKAAVVRMRQAGVKNLLMIDAGGACGQLAESVEAWGKEIVDADPEKNIVFSIHQYGFWVDPGSRKAGTWDGHQPYDIDAELTKLDALGVPIVIGEFSWTTFNQVTYTTPAAVAAYEKHGVGWLAWMWNNPADGSVDMAKTNVYNSSADLTDFGKLLIEDPTLGMKANAKKATIF
jgi:mannan endo-1,4-beta-mannosidase